MTCRLLILFILITLGCDKKLNKTGNLPGNLSELEIRYAKGFKIFLSTDGYLVQVLRPYPGATDTLQYEFNRSSNKEKIKIPAESIVCTSTTHIPMLDYLGSSHLLSGFPTLDYISSREVRKRIENNEVVDIGNVQELNVEKLLELSPDLVINYSMNNLKQTRRLEAAGLKVVVNGDYLESHPLGRAEWIKVFGILTDQYEKADSIFRYIEKEYLNTMKLSVQSGDCAFSGSLYGDTWFMPGGKNYAARLLTDAGYNYVLGDDDSNEFLQWGFENVYNLARDCDYWISPAPFANLETLLQADSRYGSFKSFQDGSVYTFDRKIGPTGGVEYLELGYLRPDIILKDLLKIRAPEVMENHEFFFYRKLR